MELAEPSLASAFDRCVAAGASIVAIAPYFLGPGSHWDRDIPALAAAAAAGTPVSVGWSRRRSDPDGALTGSSPAGRPLPGPRGGSGRRVPHVCGTGRCTLR